MNTDITLVNLTREHLDDFFVWGSDPEVARHTTWEAYSDREAARNFLINVAEAHPYFKGIVFDGKIVGSVTLTLGKGNHACRAELGYVLAKEYWGRGIATEAVRLAKGEGFEKFGLSRIEALVDPDNVASRRVLEKAGFQKEGLLQKYTIFKGIVRDRYLYSAT